MKIKNIYYLESSRTSTISIELLLLLFFSFPSSGEGCSSEALSLKTRDWLLFFIHSVTVTQITSCSWPIFFDTKWELRWRGFRQALYKILSISVPWHLRFFFSSWLKKSTESNYNSKSYLDPAAVLSMPLSSCSLPLFIPFSLSFLLSSPTPSKSITGLRIRTRKSR